MAQPKTFFQEKRCKKGGGDAITNETIVPYSKDCVQKAELCFY